MCKVLGIKEAHTNFRTESIIILNRPVSAFIISGIEISCNYYAHLMWQSFSPSENPLLNIIDSPVDVISLSRK